MSKHQSIIEELELNDHLTAYVQISNSVLGSSRVSLSFDDSCTSYQIVMTVEELQAYADKIAKALADFDEN